MPANNRNIKTDVSSKPIPQHFNTTLDNYESTEGSNGALHTKIISTDGSQLGTADNPFIVSVAEGATTFITNGVVTVTATQVELKVGASQLSGRRQLIVCPPSTGVVYWGATGVTTANGIPLSAGSAPITFSVDPAQPLSVYAINDGTNRDLKVVECK